ncbi:AraC family transcriptional regulator [Hyphomonas sp. ND6WE1B]|uniref:helix-turn-helix transcriptional regulator n=1 Tax=Hyphomonas sp. ND6WE1B TaxID=1848191 RepID=UPI00080765DB|nr:AraC family transcriptional regulator [Hyphomonas sp. ND6WE1B]
MRPDSGLRGDTPRNTPANPGPKSFANLNGKFLSLRVAGHHCDPHFHDTYSIALVREGSAECTVRDKRRVVSKGDVMIINPYEVAFGGNDDPSFIYDVLYPTIELVQDITGFRSQDTDRFPSFRSPFIRADDHSRALMQSIDDYECQVHKPSIGTIENLLGELLIGQKLVEQGPAGTSANRAAIAAACLILQEADPGELDISSIAEKVGLSKYHFIRLFRSTTRLTPGAYVRQIRLAAARQHILKGADLASAAFEAGFADQAHMTRLFKKTFGFTPGQMARGINTPRSS